MAIATFTLELWGAQGGTGSGWGGGQSQYDTPGKPGYAKYEIQADTSGTLKIHLGSKASGITGGSGPYTGGNGVSSGGTVTGGGGGASAIFYRDPSNPTYQWLGVVGGSAAATVQFSRNFSIWNAWPGAPGIGYGSQTSRYFSYTTPQGNPSNGTNAQFFTSTITSGVVIDRWMPGSGGGAQGGTSPTSSLPAFQTSAQNGDICGGAGNTIAQGVVPGYTNLSITVVDSGSQDTTDGNGKAIVTLADGRKIIYTTASASVFEVSIQDFYTDTGKDLFVKSAGQWKNVNKIFAYNGGAWRTVQSAYIKANGIWQQFYSSAILLDFTVEVFGGGNQRYFSNIQNYPNTGFGGYNKVTVQALSNRTGTLTSKGGNPSSGSAQFNIDGQWIVVAGGGSQPGTYVTWTPPGFGNPVTQSSNAGKSGTGGYNQTGGPSDGGGELYAPPNGGSAAGYWQVSGAGGGGAPGGNNNPPATSINAGEGGQGNIRCFFDFGTTTGNAGGVATMAYVTGSTGTNSGLPKMIITNNATGRSFTYTYGGGDISFSLSDIINY